jgi:chemotaxis signal transduction protein
LSNPPSVPAAALAATGATESLPAVSLLVVQLADRRFALSGAAVERVLPMAELTPLPEPPPGIAGLLSVGGALLAVVDPRPRLGLATPPIHPDQHLVLVAASTRYLLWVDRVEALLAAPIEELPDVGDGQRRQVARLGGEAVPLLAADRLGTTAATPLLAADRPAVMGAAPTGEVV